MDGHFKTELEQKETLFIYSSYYTYSIALFLQLENSLVRLLQDAEPRITMPNYLTLESMSEWKSTS